MVLPNSPGRHPSGNRGSSPAPIVNFLRRSFAERVGHFPLMIFPECFESLHHGRNDRQVTIAANSSARFDFAEFLPITVGHIADRVSEHAAEETLKVSRIHRVGDFGEISADLLLRFHLSLGVGSSSSASKITR